MREGAFIHRIGYPEGSRESRIFAVGVGWAVVLAAAGAGVGFLSWWAEGSGHAGGVAVLVAAVGFAFVTGTGAAAFAIGGAAAAMRSVRTVVDAVTGGAMSMALCGLGSWVVVLGVAMCKAADAGADAVAEQAGMLVLGGLVVMGVMSVLCGSMAVLFSRRGEGGR